MSRRLLIYDATDKSFVGRSWGVGAAIFGGFFDVVCPVISTHEAADAFLDSRGPWDEVQIWGHGGQGQPEIAGRALHLREKFWSSTARVWFRSCYVMGGQRGHQFARILSEKGIDVVGHTKLIGTWGMHSGLVGLRGGGLAPWWSPDETGDSTPWAPRTIPAWRMDLPDWAFAPMATK